MKTITTKPKGFRHLSFMIKCLLIGLLLNLNHYVFCQPLPGDVGLGTSSGGTVGGGAPLNSALGLMILLPIIYLVVKYISLQKINNCFIIGLFLNSMRNKELHKKL